MSELDETQPVHRPSEAATERTAVLDHTPEVHAFVAAVRARLADLTEEEREELVGGLDADMSDLVAERGREALPDPVGYAAELRSAAGFSPEGPSPRGAARERVMAWLDRGGATWNRWVETGDHLGLPAFAHTLRPAWWVLRALCATALFTEMYSSQGIFGFTFERAVVAVVAIVLSVQLGRGTWKLGALIRRSLFLRFVLIGLNVFAILLLPLMFSRFMAPQNMYYDVGPAYPVDGSGLNVNGRPVENIYAYDAQGHPLVGVQLVDQLGRRLSLNATQYDEMGSFAKVLSPWMNGRTRLFSVFPLPEQSADPDTGEAVGEPRLQTPPFATLPPVTLAGVRPSVLVPEATPAQKAAAAKKAAQERAQQKKVLEKKARQRAANR